MSTFYNLSIRPVWYTEAVKTLTLQIDLLHCIFNGNSFFYINVKSQYLAH